MYIEKEKLSVLLPNVQVLNGAVINKKKDSDDESFVLVASDNNDGEKKTT